MLLNKELLLFKGGIKNMYLEPAADFEAIEKTLTELAKTQTANGDLGAEHLLKAAVIIELIRESEVYK